MLKSCAASYICLSLVVVLGTKNITTPYFIKIKLNNRSLDQKEEENWFKVVSNIWGKTFADKRCVKI